jgi:hypothetical protein
MAHQEESNNQLGARIEVWLYRTTMQAKTRGLTHTPPNPPTLGDFELAFVVWSKQRVLLPPKLGGWGGHLRANLNFSKSVHHKHFHAENDRARSFI